MNQEINNMKIKMTQTIKSSGITALLAVTALTLTACSTVRDATDWVPGVDSNEEVQAKQEKEAREAREEARKAYVDKEAFAPTTQVISDADAQINVTISQKYAADEKINREDIGIEVNAGVVTLTGAVNSDESAIRAISIAKNTVGVSRVISKLIVIQLR